MTLQSSILMLNMTVLMGIILSGVFTYQAVGLAPGFAAAWASRFGTTYLLVLPTVLLVAPIAQRLTGWVVERISNRRPAVPNLNPRAKVNTMSYLTENHHLSADDDAALRQVVARLNHALDAGDYTGYASFFAEDGVFASGFGDAVGPRNVAAALEKVAPFITNKRHVAANLVISGEGDKAVVTSYLIVFERETELKYVGSAMNIDAFVRKDDRWRLTRHESTLDPATAKYIQSIMGGQ